MTIFSRLQEVIQGMVAPHETYHFPQVHAMPMKKERRVSTEDRNQSRERSPDASPRKQPRHHRDREALLQAHAQWRDQQRNPSLPAFPRNPIPANAVSLSEQLESCRTEPFQIDLSGKHFGAARLPQANFQDMILRGANFDEADLRGANFQSANLRSARFRRANLGWANLQQADLFWGDLQYADLRGAVLRYANLRGANLNHANLSGADLSHADLSWADLREADLDGAILTQTDLSGASLPSDPSSREPVPVSQQTHCADADPDLPFPSNRLDPPGDSL